MNSFFTPTTSLSTANQKEVEAIVKLASQHNVVIIPFGGELLCVADAVL